MQKIFFRFSSLSGIKTSRIQTKERWYFFSFVNSLKIYYIFNPRRLNLYKKIVQVRMVHGIKEDIENINNSASDNLQ